MVEHAHDRLADRSARGSSSRRKSGSDAVAIELGDRLARRCACRRRAGCRLRCRSPETLRRRESARAARRAAGARRGGGASLRVQRPVAVHAARMRPADSAARNRRAGRRCRRRGASLRSRRRCRTAATRRRGALQREIDARERRAARAARALGRILGVADGTDADVLGHRPTLPAPRDFGRASSPRLAHSASTARHVAAPGNADHPHAPAFDRRLHALAVRVRAARRRASA